MDNREDNIFRPMADPTIAPDFTYGFSPTPSDFTPTPLPSQTEQPPTATPAPSTTPNPTAYPEPLSTLGPPQLYPLIPAGARLWLWGDNSFGQIGDNTTVYRSSPVQTIAGGSDWNNVSVGTSHTLAIKDSGTLWGWGSNGYGQIGVTDVIDRSSPVQNSLAGDTWIMCSAGYNFSLALKINGSIWSWGANFYGQLGNGNTKNLSIPTQSSSSVFWSFVSAGYTHGAAINVFGELYCWGSNNNYECGTTNNQPYYLVPTKVNNDFTWAQVSCGRNFTLAIKTDNSMWAWGSNYFGNLGTGNNFLYSVPTQIASTGTWRQATAGNTFAAAFGEFDPPPSPTLSPTPTVTASPYPTESPTPSPSPSESPSPTPSDSPSPTPSESPSPTPSVTESPTPSPTPSASPSPTPSDTPSPTPSSTQPTPTPTNSPSASPSPTASETASPTPSPTPSPSPSESPSPTASVTASPTPSPSPSESPSPTASVTASPTPSPSPSPSPSPTPSPTALPILFGMKLWLWGDNAYGQLGDGTVLYTSSPIQTLITGLVWHNASLGSYHSAGILDNYSLWTWGRNNYGQLGDSTTINKSSPSMLGTVADTWLQVSCGLFSSAAIRTDGSLWVWGLNNTGQLGTQDLTNYSSPVQSVTTDKNWKSVSMGYDHAAGIKNDGTLWTWGGNIYGQLGTNSINFTSSPIQTFYATNDWVSVSAGNQFTLAVKNNGQIWGFGLNADGQLGDFSYNNISAPTHIIPFGSRWNNAVAGNAFGGAFGVLNLPTPTPTVTPPINKLYLWGNNNSGQLGDNTTVPRNYPAEIFGDGTNWSGVDTGNTHAAAVKTDGTIWMWGTNVFGQLASAPLGNISSPIQGLTLNKRWVSVMCGNKFTGGLENTYLYPTPTTSPTPSGTEPTATPLPTSTPIPSPTLSMTPTTSPTPSGTQPTATPLPTLSPSPTPSVTASPTPTGTPNPTQSPTPTAGIMFIWGNNSYGQLAQNNSNNVSSPVSVGGTSAIWNYVAGGGSNFGATTDDGSLWVWGENYQGQLGINDAIDYSSMVQVGSVFDNWNFVGFGGYVLGGFGGGIKNPIPSNTPSPTSPTPTVTSNSPTPTATVPGPTPTPSGTEATPTPTGTEATTTPTATPEPTPTPSATVEPPTPSGTEATVTPTLTPNPTRTPLATAAPTRTQLPTASPTPSPSNSPTPSPTPTSTAATPTPTGTMPTTTPTFFPTLPPQTTPPAGASWICFTDSFGLSSKCLEVEAGTGDFLSYQDCVDSGCDPYPTPSPTPSPSGTEPSSTPSATPSLTPSPTPSFSATSSPTPSPSSTQPTPTPTVSQPTPTPSGTMPTVTPSPTPSGTGPTPTPTKTTTPTPSGTEPTPSPTPSPSPSDQPRLFDTIFIGWR